MEKQSLYQIKRIRQDNQIKRVSRNKLKSHQLPFTNTSQLQSFKPTSDNYEFLPNMPPSAIVRKDQNMSKKTRLTQSQGDIRENSSIDLDREISKPLKYQQNKGLPESEEVEDLSKWDIVKKCSFYSKFFGKQNPRQPPPDPKFERNLKRTCEVALQLNTDSLLRNKIVSESPLLKGNSKHLASLIKQRQAQQLHKIAAPVVQERLSSPEAIVRETLQASRLGFTNYSSFAKKRRVQSQETLNKGLTVKSPKNESYNSTIVFHKLANDAQLDKRRITAKLTRKFKNDTKDGISFVNISPPHRQPQGKHITRKLSTTLAHQVQVMSPSYHGASQMLPNYSLQSKDSLTSTSTPLVQGQLDAEPEPIQFINYENGDKVSQLLMQYQQEIIKQKNAGIPLRPLTKNDALELKENSIKYEILLEIKVQKLIKCMTRMKDQIEDGKDRGESFKIKVRKNERKIKEIQKEMIELVKGLEPQSPKPPSGFESQNSSKVLGTQKPGSNERKLSYQEQSPLHILQSLSTIEQRRQSKFKEPLNNPSDPSTILIASMKRKGKKNPEVFLQQQQIRDKYQKHLAILCQANLNYQEALKKEASLRDVAYSQIKIIKKELEILKNQQLNHYKRVMKQGLDFRGEGLQWIIKSIWYLKQEIHLSYFPNYLDTASRQFLLKYTQQTLDLQESLKNISEAKKAEKNLRSSLNFKHHLSSEITIPKNPAEVRLDIIAKVNASPLKMKINSVKDKLRDITKTSKFIRTQPQLSKADKFFSQNQLIKKNVDVQAAIYGIDEIKKLIGRGIQLMQQRRKQLKAITYNEAETDDIKSTMKQLIREESDRVFKQFMYHNYEKKFNVSQEVVLYALIGEELGKQELARIQKKKRGLVETVNETKSFKFGHLRGDMTNLLEGGFRVL